MALLCGEISTIGYVLTHLGWSGGIGLRLESVLFLKVLGSILSVPI
jgi:hypothetical protein